MPNKYVNKVVIGKETKLDLTADTVTPDKLARRGITAHDKSGASHRRHQPKTRIPGCHRSLSGRPRIRKRSTRVEKAKMFGQCRTTARHI